MVPRIPVFKNVLSNGLQVMVFADKRLPVMSQYTFYKVGSRNETTGITGISHLFEHMMFQGSGKFKAGEFDTLLESHGGYSNAYTTNDMTVYYESFPPHIVEMAMELNADRMGWLDLNAEKLDREREVVREERRMRTENSNAGILDELLYAAAFVAHPYRWPVIGWMDDIEHISLDDCLAYYKSYYVPNNAVLIFSGYCDPDSVFNLAEKYYGKIRPGTIRESRITKEPPQRGERRTVHYKNTQVEACMLGYRVPGVESDDKYALDLLQIILGEGESSRLYRKMVYEAEIAADVHVDFEWRYDPNLFTFFVQLNPGRTSETAEKMIKDELDAVKTGGITSDEIEKARSIILSSLVRGMKTTSGRANRFGIIELLLGDCDKLYELFSCYRNVSPRDVCGVTEKYLFNQNSSAAILLPE